MEKDSFNVGAIDKLLKRLIAVWFCVLMFSSVAGVSSVKICAFIGQAAKLFNIGNDYPEPSLYNETEIRIASWKETTYTVAHIDPHYSGKIFMDKKRNIWIFDVERKDAGKYYLKFGIQIVRLEIILIVMEELTGEQHQECPITHPDFPKEARVVPEQILQLLRNYSQKVMTEPYESCNSLIIGLLSAILVISSLNIVLTNRSSNSLIIGLLIAILAILILNIVLTNKTYIRDGWITTKRWIRETLRRDHRSIQSTQSHDECTGVTTEGSCETRPKLPQPSKKIEMLPPESNGTDIENKDDFHQTEQAREPIHTRATAGNMKSHDSESNDEQHIELLPKGACGSNFPINESEDDFHPMGQEKKKIHIRGTEG